jgi:transcription elongation GreA/GreB family factor
MIYDKKDKIIFYAQLKKLVQTRIESARQATIEAAEALGSETKSTAGDKHETGRSMAQIEQERSNAQLIKALALADEVDRINLEKYADKISLGSLVITNFGNYFISIGMGKIIVNDKEAITISLASPIGKALLGKRVGENIYFNEKEIKVIAII